MNGAPAPGTILFSISLDHFPRFSGAEHFLWADIDIYCMLNTFGRHSLFIKPCHLDYINRSSDAVSSEAVCEDMHRLIGSKRSLA